MKDFGVIGIGNPLRKDDGIGIYLLNTLKTRNFDKKVDFIDGGTGGFNIIHYISNFKKILIIDAIDFNSNPGETIFFEYKEDKNFKKINRNTIHDEDIIKIIQLNQIINKNPKNIFIFGVQPKDVSFGNGLSNNIEEKLDKILMKLTNKINEIIT
jgi:hydrogenase maturation protease